MRGPVLALDLARVFGFCSGDPENALPTKHGSASFAREGAPTEEIFFNAMVWFRANFPGHGLIVVEAPIPPIFIRGHTNTGATRVAYGLTAVAEATARELGIKIREARVDDVRDHFIGQRIQKGKIAKPKVFARCQAMGIECEDFNDSDAVAVWSYACGLLIPARAMDVTPLFGVRP